MDPGLTVARQGRDDGMDGAMNLSGKTALITGGGTGIGRAIALVFAGSGADVAVNYSRSRADADATVEAIRKGGRRALAVEANISREDQVEAMVRRVVQDLGRLDILVNNAGTTRFIAPADLDALKSEIWDEIFAVNVKGTFFCIRAAARVMREGHIINIGSISGATGSGSSIAYAASKGAIHTMTKSFARAFAPRIAVNAIAPGLIDTRWHAGREANSARIVAALPAKRIGRPEDIAHIALCIAAAGNFMTGQIIVVDGGELLGVDLMNP
jgi:3-oxoacyl-[acyl-carrier protein] reductase